MIIHLTILLCLVLLNSMPESYINKRKYILPLSFIVIAVYLGIRYDYGLDYMSYYNAFLSNREDYFGKEVLFYKLLHAFPYYYQFILFQTGVVVFSLYFFVRKYVDPKLYALFFLLFFTMNGMVFNMISAMRSTFAACIIWWAIELFYIERRALPLYLILVSIASLFHTSAIVFFLIPIFIFILPKIPTKPAFFLLVLADILSMFSTVDLFSVLFGTEYLSGYSGHLAAVENASIFGALHKAIWFFPAYYLVTNKQLFTTRQNAVVYSIAYLYFILFFLGLTFEERFTTYLFIFAIISFSIIFLHLDTTRRKYFSLPIVIFCIYGMYLFYKTMQNNLLTTYSEGNYLFYKTIFDSPYFPF